MKKIIITILLLGLILLAGCDTIIKDRDTFCKSKGYDIWKWESLKGGDDDFYCMSVTGGLFVMDKDYEAWRKGETCHNNCQIQKELEN